MPRDRGREWLRELSMADLRDLVEHGPPGRRVHEFDAPAEVFATAPISVHELQDRARAELGRRERRRQEAVLESERMRLAAGVAAFAGFVWLLSRTMDAEAPPVEEAAREERRGE